MKVKSPAKRWALALALVMALGALVLSGCGGSSGGSSGSSTTASATSSTAKSKGGFDISDEQRACLKEKGVELPEFKGGAGGAPQAGEAPEGFEPQEGGEPPRGGKEPEGAPSGGKGGPGGKGFKKMRKAFEECGVETGGFKGGPGKSGPGMNSAAFKKRIKEYVACVRENGYELAEPNLTGEGPVFDQSESESAAFKKASAKCQDLLGEP